VYSKAQDATLERLSGADWRVLAVLDGEVWIAKQGRLMKVFSRIDVDGALQGVGRLDVVEAFGKDRAIALVDDAFSIKAAANG